MGKLAAVSGTRGGKTHRGFGVASGCGVALASGLGSGLDAGDGSALAVGEVWAAVVPSGLGAG